MFRFPTIRPLPIRRATSSARYTGGDCIRADGTFSEDAYMRAFRRRQAFETAQYNGDPLTVAIVVHGPDSV